MNKFAAFVCAVSLFLSFSMASASSDSAVIPPKKFTLMGMDGQQHQLGEWRNKVVLLNFWASWCSPCQTEIRDLVVWQEQYGGRSLQVVSIGMDDEKRLRNVQRTLGINYPVLLAAENAHSLLADFGNLTGVIPYSVLISRTGEVVYRHAGVVTDEIFKAQVLPLLQ